MELYIYGGTGQLPSIDFDCLRAVVSGIASEFCRHLTATQKPKSFEIFLLSRLTLGFMQRLYKLIPKEIHFIRQIAFSHT